MSWETQFKIAILERDPEKIAAAHNAIPPLEDLNLQQAQELYDYLEQSVAILSELKKDGANEIDRLKKIKQFLKTNPYGGGKTM